MRCLVKANFSAAVCANARKVMFWARDKQARKIWNKRSLDGYMGFLRKDTAKIIDKYTVKYIEDLYDKAMSQ